MERLRLTDGCTPRPTRAAPRRPQESRPFWKRLCLGTFFLLGSALLQNSLPYLAGKMLDAVAEGLKGDPAPALGKLNRMAAALVGAAVASGAVTGARAYVFNSTAEKVVAAVRAKLFRSLLRQEMGFFDGEKTGNLVSRITADTEQLKDAATTNVSMFLRAAASAAAGIAMMLYTSWQLTLLARRPGEGGGKGGFPASAVRWGLLPQM